MCRSASHRCGGDSHPGTVAGKTGSHGQDAVVSTACPSGSQSRRRLPGPWVGGSQRRFHPIESKASAAGTGPANRSSPRQRFAKRAWPGCPNQASFLQQGTSSPRAHAGTGDNATGVSAQAAAIGKAVAASNCAALRDRLSNHEPPNSRRLLSRISAAAMLAGLGAASSLFPPCGKNRVLGGPGVLWRVASLAARRRGLAGDPLVGSLHQAASC